MEIHDDDLIRFEAEGAAPLPVTTDQGYVETEDARIWYACYKREHAVYLARSIPNAEFVDLPGVSHFAPLQRPELFNRTIFAFLSKIHK